MLLWRLIATSFDFCMGFSLCRLSMCSVFQQLWTRFSSIHDQRLPIQESDFRGRKGQSDSPGHISGFLISWWGYVPQNQVHFQRGCCSVASHSNFVSCSCYSWKPLYSTFMWLSVSSNWWFVFPYSWRYCDVIFRLVFSVGNIALNGFRMIERHYFRDQVQKN